MARQGYRAIAFLFVLSFLGSTHRLFGAPPDLPVVDLASGEVDRAEVARFLSRKLRVSAQLKPPAPLLLESLRWATPDPATFACRPASPDVKAAWPFAELLTQAGEQVARLELQESLEALKRARMLLPCSPSAVPREQLRRLLELEAIARLLLKDSRGADLLLEVLSIDPAWTPDGGFPPKLVPTYQKVVKSHARLKFHTIDISALPGEVVMDGEPAKGSVAIYPGRHLVQLKGPNGELRSALVDIPDKGPIELSRLADFALPSAAVAKEELASSLRRQALDPYQRDGIERYLTAEKQRVMTLFVEPGEELEVVIRFYEVGKGLIDLRKVNAKKYIRGAVSE